MLHLFDFFFFCPTVQVAKCIDERTMATFILIRKITLISNISSLSIKLHQLPRDCAFKSGRRDVLGSIPGCSCRLSLSEVPPELD